MKKLLKGLVLMLCLAFTMSSCYTNVHVVGDGAQSGVTVSKKQWYAVWGLVPIGQEADTKLMAGGKEDYTITTTHSFVDLVISAVVGIVSIQVKTVEVQK